MSNPLYFACAALAALTCAEPAFGQLRQPGEPAAATTALSAAVPMVRLNAADHETLARQELTLPIGPLRYGVVLPTAIDVTGGSSYELTDDGSLVFRTRIHAPRAYSLGLEFSHFDLPAGGKLFLYDDGLKNVYGAYDASNRIPDTGEFVIEPFPGDSVIVEYSQPVDSTELANIVIRGVIYDYRDIFRLERALDDDAPSGAPKGGCALIDVNCPEGNPYPNQKRATLRTLYGGGLCSGALINNTLSDGTRYFYTANHCGQGTTTVFRFNYQNSICSGGTAPTNQNVTGAVVLASDVDTDGRLLRITSTIPTGYNPYYSGWSRSTSNLTFGMSMHHPSGGTKKISIDTNGGGQTTANFSGIGPVKCWAMSFQSGGTLGGSSGGPLFDQNNRIRGALTGGPDSPCEVNYYGRFFTFWNETTIAQYLDPNTSGVTTVDGFDPNGSPPQGPTLTSLNPSSVAAFSPGTVTLTGTNFTGTTAVTVGGTQLLPVVGFVVIDATTIQINAPNATAFGGTNVTVTTPQGTSNAQVLSYFETQPLTLAGPLFLVNGGTATYSWGGKANQITLFDVALTNQTSTFNGQPFLISLFSLPLGSTNAAGIGSIAAPVNGAPVGLNIYTQILTVAPPGTDLGTVQLSNIHATQVLF